MTTKNTKYLKFYRKKKKSGREGKQLGNINKLKK